MTKAKGLKDLTFFVPRCVCLGACVNVNECEIYCMNIFISVLVLLLIESDLNYVPGLCYLKPSFSYFNL